MKRWQKYALWIALWGGVAGYLVYALTLTDRHRTTQPIESVELETQGDFLSIEQVQAWLCANDVNPLGVPLKQLDMGALETMLLSHPVVAEARISVNHSGVLRIEVEPQRPLVRLRVEGYDLYVTRDGFVFPVPFGATAYVPVLTGSYQPPFGPGFSGEIEREIERQMGELEAEITALEKQKYPLYRSEIQNDEAMRGVRRMFVKRRWFEGDGSFEGRVAALRERKVALRRKYRYEGQKIDAEIAKIERDQERVRATQKKLQKKAEDIHNLIIFVNRIAGSDFWSGEVVQLMVRERESGAVEVGLVLRSTGAEVLFGGPERVGEKLDALRLFFDDVLAREGWGAFETIDIRYENQIVCS